MSVLTGITATAAAALLAVGGLAGASTALADTSAPSGSASSSSAGLKAACKRVDKQLNRATKLQTRFHADATTRGSIAFLAARIDRAKAEGETALAQVLEDRMAVRKQVDAQLPEILSHLQDAKATCTSAGLPA